MIVENFLKVWIIVESFNFKIDCILTDGDISFNAFHENWFHRYITCIMRNDEPFISKIQKIVGLKRIPASDFLHLLKSARSHLRNHILFVDPEMHQCYFTRSCY